MLNLYITSNLKCEGKTFITAGIAATMQSLGYSTSVYKPIQTGGIDIKGFTQSPDLTFIKTMDPYINTYFTHVLKSKNEPAIAAEDENLQIDIDYINNEYQKICSSSECTIIDGDSGIYSPIAPNLKNIELIQKLQIPVLIVTSPNTNTINSTLLSIEALEEKNINLRGVVINNIDKNCPKSLLNSIPRVIEEYSNAKILGLMPHIEDKFSPEDLISNILNGIDIESIFNVKIEKLDFE